MSGSSASPMRSVVCAQAIPLDTIRSAATAARRNVFIRLLPSLPGGRDFINTGAALPIRLGAAKSIDELLQHLRAAALVRNDVRRQRQLVGAVAGGGVRPPDQVRLFALAACRGEGAAGMERAAGRGKIGRASRRGR